MGINGQAKVPLFDHTCFAEAGKNCLSSMSYNFKICWSLPFLSEIELIRRKLKRLSNVILAGTTHYQVNRTELSFGVCESIPNLHLLGVTNSSDQYS